MTTTFAASLCELPPPRRPHLDLARLKTGLTRIRENFKGIHACQAEEAATRLIFTPT